MGACLLITRPHVIFVAAITLSLVACGGYQGLAPVHDNTPRRAQASTPPAARTAQTPARPGYHVVQAGETLYSIAWKYGHDHEQVAAWNRIGPPYRIYRGQRLAVAPPAVVVARPSPPPNNPSTVPLVTELPPPTIANVPAPSLRRDEPELLDTRRSVIKWQWPVQGPMVAGNSSNEKGIRLTGKEGQPVRAAAAGRVVYSGSGLVGLGELVIIKHDKSFLSAYAHNKKLLVKEDDTVAAGQPIAEMGKSAAERVALYFEIRKDGKPVDPLLYLPKRP